MSLLSFINAKLKAQRLVSGDGYSVVRTKNGTKLQLESKETGLSSVPIQFSLDTTSGSEELTVKINRTYVPGGYAGHTGLGMTGTPFVYNSCVSYCQTYKFDLSTLISTYPVDTTAKYGTFLTLHQSSYIYDATLDDDTADLVATPLPKVLYWIAQYDASATYITYGDAFTQKRFIPAADGISTLFGNIPMLAGIYFVNQKQRAITTGEMVDKIYGYFYGYRFIFIGTVGDFHVYYIPNSIPAPGAPLDGADRLLPNIPFDFSFTTPDFYSTYGSIILSELGAPSSLVTCVQIDSSDYYFLLNGDLSAGKSGSILNAAIGLGGVSGDLPTGTAFGSFASNNIINLYGMYTGTKAQVGTSCTTYDYSIEIARNSSSSATAYPFHDCMITSLPAINALDNVRRLTTTVDVITDVNFTTEEVETTRLYFANGRLYKTEVL